MQKAIELVLVLTEKSSQQHLKSAHVSVGRGRVFSSVLASHWLKVHPTGQGLSCTFSWHMCGHQTGLMETSTEVSCRGERMESGERGEVASVCIGKHCWTHLTSTGARMPTGTTDRQRQENLKLQPQEELEGWGCSKCLQLHIGTSRALCLSSSQCHVKEPRLS